MADLKPKSYGNMDVARRQFGFSHLGGFALNLAAFSYSYIGFVTVKHSVGGSELVKLSLNTPLNERSLYVCVCVCSF